MDDRKALLMTQKDLDSRAARIAKELAKELEAKNIFHMLPREIRDKIWRILLLRPSTILPSYVHYHYYTERKMGNGHYWQDQHQRRRYGYQWAENRQTVKDFPGGYRGWCKFEPEYNEGSQDLTLSILTEPTSKQAECIARGETQLPFTFSDEFGSQVGCNVVYRGVAGDQFAQVINRTKLSVEPLSGLSIMRVNRQALLECREVLYGGNTFAFNTGPGDLYQFRLGIHEHDELEHFPHWIPGMLKRNGAAQTPRQLNNAIDRMFVHDGFHPKFVARDPMLRFFHRIGRVNASTLTKIKIEGCMKTVYNVFPDEPSENAPLGFARVLDILTTVLKNVCPNLRELLQHMEDKIQNRDFKDSMFWDDDPYNNAGKSDGERIDKVVEKVVESLGSLKVLKLEGYQFSQSSDPNDNDGEPTAELDDEWGRAARWMNVVKERSRKREAEAESQRPGLVTEK